MDYLKIFRDALRSHGSPADDDADDGARREPINPPASPPPGSDLVAAKPESGVSGSRIPNGGEIDRAVSLMNRAGARLVPVDGETIVGLWSDLDNAATRHALEIIGCGEMPVVRYLDGAGVSMRYKARRVKGDPVPMNVLTAMEAHPDAPWKVRDQMFKEMKWRRAPVPWGGRGLLPRPQMQHDPETGVRPIRDWGAACGRAEGQSGSVFCRCLIGEIEIEGHAPFPGRWMAEYFDRATGKRYSIN